MQTVLNIEIIHGDVNVQHTHHTEMHMYIWIVYYSTLCKRLKPCWYLMGWDCQSWNWTHRVPYDICHILLTYIVRYRISLYFIQLQVQFLVFSEMSYYFHVNLQTADFCQYRFYCNLLVFVMISAPNIFWELKILT